MVREYYITDKMYKLTTRLNPELLAKTEEAKRKQRVERIADEISMLIKKSDSLQMLLSQK